MFFQHLITCNMPASIVDLLKIIHIQQKKTRDFSFSLVSQICFSARKLKRPVSPSISARRAISFTRLCTSHTCSESGFESYPPSIWSL